MKPTLTERADKILMLYEDLPATQDPTEKEFRKEAWSLCQQVKDREASSDGGQFVPSSPLF
jgi:hypothetical protein